MKKVIKIIKKNLLSLLVIIILFITTGCSNKPFDLFKEEENYNLITITSKDKGYLTTFKSSNNIFVQTSPKYNQIHSEDLSVFISFSYIESSKEAYDYTKTHNFLGYEYAKGEVKDYKWNNYSGYTYNVKENEMYFRILLVDDKEKSIILSAYVGDKHTKNLNLTKDFDSEDFQKFLNTIEFKYERE